MYKTKGPKINAEFSSLSSFCHPHHEQKVQLNPCSHRNKVPQPLHRACTSCCPPSAWWCHPALAEQSITRNTHTQDAHSAKTPNTPTQTSSSPHDTNKMQDAALCSFSFFQRGIPMGSHTTGGRAHPAMTQCPKTVEKTFHHS